MAHAVTYYAYDVMSGTLLAELPATSVTYSKRLNSSGQFRGSLSVVDMDAARKIDLLNASRPNRTLLIIDVDGAPQWGGLLTARAPQNSPGDLAIGGNEATWYLSQRFQAADYTKHPAGPYWTTKNAKTTDVAAQVIYDALAKHHSAFWSSGPFPWNIQVREQSPNASLVAVSYPLSQNSKVDSIVNALSSSGYQTGFDFAIDITWLNGLQGGTPVFTLNLDYPRRGRTASATSAEIQSSGFESYEWPEGGQANRVVMTGTNASQHQISVTAQSAEALSAGYPLYEDQVSATESVTKSLLGAMALDELALSEWPQVVPTATLPMFGDLPPGYFTEGDDIRWIHDPDDRFPSGFDVYLRCIGTDYTIADRGLSTVKLTFNSTPSLSPTAQLPF